MPETAEPGRYEMPVLPLGVAWIAWPIKAAVAASRFQPWRYPVSLRFVH